jgi:hypothetical protein
MPELDREQVIRMPVTRGKQPLASLRTVGQPWRELVMDGDQLAAGAERHQRRHEIALFLDSRFARDPILALVAGQAPIRLDVEAKVLGRPLHPSLDHLRAGDAVEGGVDLDDREELCVVGELVALPSPVLELIRVEVSVVGPIAGPDRNRRAHMSKQ